MGASWPRSSRQEAWPASPVNVMSMTTKQNRLECGLVKASCAVLTCGSHMFSSIFCARALRLGAIMASPSRALDSGASLFQLGPSIESAAQVLLQSRGAQLMHSAYPFVSCTFWVDSKAFVRQVCIYARIYLRSYHVAFGLPATVPPASGGGPGELQVGASSISPPFWS